MITRYSTFGPGSFHVPTGWLFLRAGTCPDCGGPIAWCDAQGAPVPINEDGKTHVATCPVGPGRLLQQARSIEQQIHHA